MYNLVEFWELSRLKIVNLFFLMMWLSGCAVYKPFVDRRREAGAKTPETLYVGASTPESPAICYNSLTTPYEEVKKMADEECRRQGTGTMAEPVNQTVFTCRIFVPNHLFFKCVK